MTVDERRIQQLMARQFGCCSRAQATDCGVDYRELRRRIALGRMVLLFPQVVAGAETPSDPWSRNAMAAVLQCGNGSLVSHESAGVLWKLPVMSPDGVHVTVATNRRPKAVRGIVVHGSAYLEAGDRVMFGQLPATSVHRTILDLAAALPAADTQRLVDDALARGLSSPGRLEEVCRRLRGRRGVALVSEIASTWKGDGRLGSVAEAVVARWLRAQRLPRPVRQHPVVSDGRRYFLDFAWPDRLVVLEVDSFEFHDGPERFREDRIRANWLAARGWTVLRTTLAEVRGGGDELAIALRRALC